jgi:predicted metal-dependent HD superfamily phosphohydrolase
MRLRAALSNTMMDDNGPFQTEDADREFLLGEWRSLMAGYEVDGLSTDSARPALFDKLSSLYSEPGRAYHNLSHIKSLLSSAWRIRQTLVDYNSVRLAIWFHDAIYDTRRKDNEELSAELAQSSLRPLHVPEATIDSVRHMILATKHHASDENTPDLEAFLDLDLSILGSDQRLYRQYSAAIRTEYAWVPDLLYRQGRASVLLRFLDMEWIFQTADTRARLEAQAKINLAEEIAILDG